MSLENQRNREMRIIHLKIIEDILIKKRIGSIVRKSLVVIMTNFKTTEDISKKKNEINSPDKFCNDNDSSQNNRAFCRSKRMGSIVRTCIVVIMTHFKMTEGILTKKELY